MLHLVLYVAEFSPFYCRKFGIFNFALHFHECMSAFMVSWVVMPCSDVVVYQHLGIPCFSYSQCEDGGGKALQNDGVLLHH
jgi:hypothetical protein